MNQDLILLPLFAMFLLTFGIGLWMLKLRFKAVKEDSLNPGYFQLNRGAKLPDYLAKVTNHYTNLFELPVLFYVVCLVLYAGHKVDGLYIGLTWAFVGVRYIHAYIHTTSNILKQRRLAFLVGSLILSCIWARLLVQVVSA
ncbi:MAG: MAPEG family protein [Methylobacter sp.]|nr:MAPEG family protein [Methylobacter sp.]